MTDPEIAQSEELARLREEVATLRARAELAEAQRDYWIEQATLHGHGPSGDDLPLGEEVSDDEQR